MRDFGPDPHPGAPRILFVGWAHSSHTHGWINLLEGAGFNVRLYALPLGFPPEGWPVRTYVTQSTGRRFDPALRVKLYPFNKPDLWLRNRLVRALHGPEVDAPRLGLAQVVRRWRPHVIHSLGLDPAGFFTLQTLRRFGLLGQGRWVLQLRGGSDLEPLRHDPEVRPRLLEALAACDALITDNRHNFSLLAELGLAEAKIADIAPIPGSGGVDAEALSERWSGPPSARRLVLWPKAYECPYSKALPVLEALRQCRDELRGLRVDLLAMDQETRRWHHALPADLREICRPRERIPHAQALELMLQARVMLAPSLVDGIPNSLYEAMACGAVPLVSPLETIRTLVREGEHALFCHNLRAEDIAQALRRALADDALADALAARNLELVRRVAHRPELARRVRAWYAAQAALAGGERV